MLSESRSCKVNLSFLIYFAEKDISGDHIILWLLVACWLPNAWISVTWLWECCNSYKCKDWSLFIVPLVTKQTVVHWELSVYPFPFLKIKRFCLNLFPLFLSLVNIIVSRAKDPWWVIRVYFWLRYNLINLFIICLIFNIGQVPKLEMQQLVPYTHQEVQLYKNNI